MSAKETQAVRMARLEEHVIQNGKAAERVAETLEKWEAVHTAEIGAMKAEIKEIRDKQAAVSMVLANSRAFVAGMGTVLTLIGAAIGAGVSQAAEFFK
jgi:hypothetical protein